MPGSLASAVARALAHPLSRGRGLDHPDTTALRLRIIARNPALQAIYGSWYRRVVGRLPTVDGEILELGSGAGFLRRFVPSARCSEVFCVPGIDLVCDGQRLPFADRSLRAVVLVDVLHHIPDVARFFAEAARCLVPGGRIIAVEPWVTPFARLVYAGHHEPFDPRRADWAFPSSGPLSGANGALPWIVCVRDRRLFSERFPLLRIQRTVPIMPFRYLFSGGVSQRPLAPGWFDRVLERIEADMGPLLSLTAMFALIEIEKRAL